MTLHDLLAVALLLAQLSSWLSLREGQAALKAELRAFTKATNREIDQLEGRVSALEASR